ncbi:winged helix-turn-helix domain-containing protein [Oxalobacteraceae bacterium OM1]|nr:winged helix-turn-helix domain-containing protein [Oxalobacteraceae bacterium OM1]
MKKRRAADIYIRFLELAEAVRGLPTLPQLDPLEERILAFVARIGQQGERLSVRDMMARQEFGAAATIHTRLKSMRKKGWIELIDTEDTRRKQIVLTDDALCHLERLSKAMLRATRA